ncbi:MAG: SUF system Fe-S cluster assembly regulator [Pseudomonadota bacterium]
MLRISKLSDYAVVIVSSMASENERHTLDELSHNTNIPLATVRKLLRQLTLSGLCIGKKGAKGGYSLAFSPEEISVLDVLQAVDGELALTQCARSHGCDCSLVDDCGLKRSWQIINSVIRDTLTRLSIADLGSNDFDSQMVRSRLIASADSVARISAVNRA